MTLEELKTFIETDLDTIISNYRRERGMPIDGLMVAHADIEDEILYVDFREPWYSGSDRCWIDEGGVVESCVEAVTGFLTTLLLEKHNVRVVKSGWIYLELKV